MYIDKDSIQIKINNTYTSIGTYITEAKFGYYKLWTDAGRNLSGKMTATLVGIFPKITLNFRRLNKTELELLIPIINASKQYIKYYDPEKQAVKEIATYTNDLELTNKNIVDASRTNETFSVSFIALERRK